jgi:hypothetical protein
VDRSNNRRSVPCRSRPPAQVSRTNLKFHGSLLQECWMTRPTMTRSVSFGGDGVAQASKIAICTLKLDSCASASAGLHAFGETIGCWAET